MQREYNIERESAIVSESGCYPSRVVLGLEGHLQRRGDGACYYTALEVFPTDGRLAYYISGHYNLTRDEAESDYQKRWRRLADF